MYTAKIGKKIYVLHAFQKKAKKGIATSKGDIEIVKDRLKKAIELTKQED